MAVYYRYRSGVETFSVPVPAPSVTVAELKRLIMGTSRHGHGRTRGRGPREGVALSNAQTGEEYADDSALVLRNSTVVVRRVAGPPAEIIVASSSPRPPKWAQGGSSSSSSDSAARSSASAGAEDDVDEAKAISAVIDAAQLKWEVPSQGARRYGRRGASAAHDGGAPPPASYVCRRCRVAGHFIQHCPTNGDPRFDTGRSPAPTPVMSAPAVPAPAPASHEGGRIPPELHCKICKKVMADAVLTSKCCFNSFCDRCIREHIVASSKCACGARARADDLIPNPAIRATIANMLAARADSSGASGGTEKPRSSVGSNAAAEPAPAASQESRRSHVTSEKEVAASAHSDGSGSSKSKNTTTPAVPEPRKQPETTDTAGTRASHADHHYGYGSVVPSGPACYNPFLGGTPWVADPYMYYSGGYPMPGAPHHVNAMCGTPVPPPPRRDGSGSCGYHGERHGSRKRTDHEDPRHEECSFKRRCGGSRSQVVV